MPHFLPATLNEWLGLIVQFVVAVSAAIGVTVRFVRRPLEEQAARDRQHVDEKFKEQGERIGLLAQSLATNAAKIETTDRVVERLHLTQTALAEQFGRQDARMDRVLENQEKHERERLAEDRNIGERLARIETRLDVHDDLKQIFGQLLANNGK